MLFLSQADRSTYNVGAQQSDDFGSDKGKQNIIESFLEYTWKEIVKLK